MNASDQNTEEPSPCVVHGHARMSLGKREHQAAHDLGRADVRAGGQDDPRPRTDEYDVRSPLPEAPDGHESGDRTGLKHEGDARVSLFSSFLRQSVGRQENDCVPDGAHIRTMCSKPRFIPREPFGDAAANNILSAPMDG